MPTVKRTRKPAPVNAQHPLHTLIPNANYEGYVDRKIGGVWALDAMEAAFQEQHNVAIFGPTGCAKTTLVYAFGYRKQLPVVNIPCNGAADPDMLYGGWRPQPDGSWRLMPGPLYYVTRYGGIALYDEITMMPAKIAALSFGALDSRRTMHVSEYQGAQGCDCEDKTQPCKSTDDGTHLKPQRDLMGNIIEATYVLHADCLNASTWNPGYAGTYAVNEALFNRFNHKLIFDYSPQVEAELITSPTLIEFATQLRASARNNDIVTPVSTNALMEFEQNAYHPLLGITYAVENFLAMFRESERASVKESMRNFIAAVTSELSDAGDYEDEDSDDVADSDLDIEDGDDS